MSIAAHFVSNKNNPKDNSKSSEVMLSYNYTNLSKKQLPALRMTELWKSYYLIFDNIPKPVTSKNQAFQLTIDLFFLQFIRK